MRMFNKIKECFTYKNRKQKAFKKNNYKTTFSINNFYSSDFDSQSELDMITVAFNVPKLIDYQIKMYKKMLKGNYIQIICDNSTIQEKAEQIRNICEKENITYIRVEDRKLPNGFSDSHGIALNWIYKNLIKQRQNDFALIDHDMFPIKELDVCEYLKRSTIFGRVLSPNKKIWCLWPGFSFFSWERVKNLKLNFKRYKFWGLIKVKNADTGSANWSCLYSKIKKEDLAECICELYDYITNTSLTNALKPNVKTGIDTQVMYMDNKNWIHMVDGSDRYNIQSDKMAMIYARFDEILKNNR